MSPVEHELRRDLAGTVSRLNRLRLENARLRGALAGVCAYDPVMQPSAFKYGIECARDALAVSVRT